MGDEPSGEILVTRIAWQLAEGISQLLDREEREAVQGDFAEAGENAYQALLGVIGLVIRRQLLLWKNWRPWLAAFGVALPSSFLLMGASLSVSCTYQRLAWHKIFDACSPTGREGFLLLFCHLFLLIAWAWTGGFLVGSVSRRTLWVSAALCVIPCLFCLFRFRVESMSRVSLILFLLPAIWGVHRGLRVVRINLAVASALAVTVTVLMISAWSNKALYILNWGLVWPAWYLVATARRPIAMSRKERNGE